jgi:hypothetical protein
MTIKPPSRTAPMFIGKLVAILIPLGLGTAPALLATGPAAALSEIGREDLPPPAGMPPMDGSPTEALPMPDPLGGGEGETGESGGSGKPNGARPEIDENGPLPEVIYNLDRLPEPVRRMHDRIVEAAKSGDPERLRPLLGFGDDATLLSLGEPEGDPVETLRSLSGDAEGQEIMAIMEEVLSAGFLHLDAGTPNEVYVWPYFYGYPLDKLDARQRVELFKIVTAGDVEDMKQFGQYIFYRAGITPEGRWVFFVAGE